MRRAAKRREGWRFAIALSTSVVAAVVICLAMNWDLGRRGPFGIVLAATTAATMLLSRLSRLVVRPIRARNEVNDLLVAIGVRRRAGK